MLGAQGQRGMTGEYSWWRMGWRALKSRSLSREAANTVGCPALLSTYRALVPGPEGDSRLLFNLGWVEPKLGGPFVPPE